MKSVAMPAWDGFDVSAHVQRSLPVPVLVDSAVNLMAVGERTTHWSEHENLFFVNMADSIRSAIISSGQLQRGTNGSAGDLGHIQLTRGADTPCTCGNYGCLEALASWPAIAEQLRGQGLDVNDRTAMADLVAAGNPKATQAIRQAGRDIGEVMATVVSLLNPSVIVVGGVIGDMGEQVVAGVREVIYKRCPPLTTSQLRVTPAATGPYAAVHGASQMVIDHVLSPGAVQGMLAVAPTETAR
jgi:glucokinase